MKPDESFPSSRSRSLSRRELFRRLLAGSAATALSPLVGSAQPRSSILTRRIPSSGETLPVVGLGSWITFNVGDDAVARENCTSVMRAFFEAGGRMIDSSPMYGSSQDVIGYGLARLRSPSALFSAEKVWTGSDRGAARQLDESRRKWGVPRFDLVQVHNLVNWEHHLPMLFAMKAARQIRYVGITTSEGRRHTQIEQLLRTQPLDFVQVTYNVLDREVEQRILPIARERGIAVIANRPFREGALIREVERHPLPAWARDIDCVNWAQFLLKFIVAHPAVTCAIPATTRPEHATENMGAATGELPDEAMRKRNAEHVERL
jgi:diketogulonate reductase-like aldo/keto reductase